MRKLFWRARRAFIRLVQRFWTNTPHNLYEEAAFNAVRSWGTTFGKALV